MRGLTERRERELADRLSAFKASLTEEEIDRIVAQTRELRAFQEQEDSPEDLAKIPLLKREDIRREVEPVILEERKIGEIPVLYHRIPTNGISYFRLLFDCGRVPDALFPYIGILKAVIGLVDTEHYSYRELYTETDLLTGGLTPVTNIYTDARDLSKRKITFELKGKAFHKNLPDAMRLAQEMLLKSDFTDTKRLAEILAELKSRMQSSLIGAGHTVASGRAMSYFSETAALQEVLGGMDFYRLVERLIGNWEQEKQTLPGRLQALVQAFFCRENLMFDFIAQEDGQYELFADRAERFFRELYFAPAKAEPFRVKPEKKNEGFMSASQVQYVCRAGNFVQKGLNYTGALRILKGIFNNDYLWNNVRVKGGAYGCMSNFNRIGDAYLISYRDPNLERTMEVYEGVVDYLKNFNVSDRDMNKFIIGTMSSLDRPMNPAAKGARSMNLYMNRVSEEMLRSERGQILDAQQEDIRALADVVKAMLDQKLLCVIGSEEKIEEQRDMFLEVRTLS